MTPEQSAHASKPRSPGLDGVRALAVLAVMAFHEGFRAAPGGFLGVDVFFVLSGYLITDLLVTQKDRSGRLDLRGFWIRRARRLLPALGVVLVIVTAAVALIDPGQLTALRPALMAAVTYSSNWYQALHRGSYFASFGPPPPLQHLWSLAIEEQFYLIWPLILGVVLMWMRSRRDRALVAWLGAAVSALLMALLYVPGGDPSRVYYGTDTHATALLVGCALALTWPLARLATAPAPVAARLDILGIAALGVLGWALGHFAGSDPAVYPVGLLIAALAAAGLVAAAASPGTVSAMLSWPPLRWLGVRSYGIYLWHWPVIALLTAVAGPRPGPTWLWLAEPPLAIGLAAASWKWVEVPILRDGLASTCWAAYGVVAASVAEGRRAPARALPALLAAIALTVACTAGYGIIHPPSASGLAQQLTRGEQVSARSATYGPPGAAAAPRRGAHRVAGAARRGTCGRRADTALGGKIAGSQVTAIGDSVMLAAAPQLAAALPGVWINAQESRQMSAGLAVIRGLAATGRLRPVLIVGLGTNGTVTPAQIRALLRTAGATRSVVLVNTFEARPWEQEVDSALAAAARDYPNVVLANWAGAIRLHTALLWDDGVHPRPSGARLYARVVAAAVRSACTAVARPSSQISRLRARTTGP